MGKLLYGVVDFSPFKSLFASLLSTHNHVELYNHSFILYISVTNMFNYKRLKPQNINMTSVYKRNGFH